MRLLVACACSGALLFSSSIATHASAQQSCWKPTEVESAKVRRLQSMLMVAALQCNSWRNPSRDRYNAFIITHRPVLNSHNDVLKLYFIRAHGFAGGQAAYDRFTTVLANADAHDAAAMSSDYCETAATFVRLATDAHPAALATLSDELGSRPVGVGRECGAEDAPPVATLALAQPMPKPAPPELFSVPAPEPAFEPEVTPVTTPAVAVAVADEIDAAPDPAVTAKALAAAASALQAAAEALRAVSSPTLPEAEPIGRTPVPGPGTN